MTFRNDQLLDMNITCSFKKSNIIILPAVIRKKVLFYPGMELSVGFGTHSGQIAILRSTDSSSDNKMVISNSGAIRIPAEIKKLESLKIGDTFRVFVLGNKNGVVLEIYQASFL